MIERNKAEVKMYLKHGEATEKDGRFFMKDGTEIKMTVGGGATPHEEKIKLLVDGSDLATSLKILEKIDENLEEINKLIEKHKGCKPCTDEAIPDVCHVKVHFAGCITHKGKRIGNKVLVQPVVQPVKVQPVTPKK